VVESSLGEELRPRRRSSEVVLVCPCFFDIPSFLRLRDDAREALAGVVDAASLHFVVIDDTAGQDAEVRTLAELADVRLVTPPYNLGHQAALVYALRGATEIDERAIVVTLDADGEDRPADLPALLRPILDVPESARLVSIALRTKRTERATFKVFYFAFKVLFRALTGTVIRNGNFAAYRGWLLRDVIFHPHFDQCYSSSFVSLPLRVVTVPLPRGQRYAGQSRMGYMGLFTHGVRMLMPFSERIATRGIVGSGIMLAAAASWLTVSLALRRELALPLGALILGTMTLGFSVVLFATFSQTKARSLRGLTRPSRAPTTQDRNEHASEHA
jgi:hypothetical protein